MNQGKKTAVEAVEEKRGLICQAADQIWEYAELSLQEEKSAAYYCRVLRQGGFAVAHGEFGADMQVYSQNDGPVTILFDIDP